jgi:NADH-quinone oxidoreductase subunit D
MLRTEEMVLNLGPQHPSMHGVLRLVVKIDGEIIREIEPVIGYLHRGTEKLAEDLNYTQIIPYTDRLDYLSSMTNNYVVCHATETLMGLEIPEKAEYLRVIVMEMNRVASHLLWLGTFLLDVGALTPFLYCFRDREQILDMFNELCGARLTYNYMRVGGVKWDAPAGWLDKVKNFADYMINEIENYHELISGNEIFLQRTKGIGVITKEMALSYSLSGANIRCTGIDWDLRKKRPYSVYDRFDFEVPVGKTGDILDKYHCRMKEMVEAMKIVKQAVEGFPEGGATMGKVPRVLRVPEGEAFVSIEAPRGELGCHIVSKGKDKPWRIKFRRPSFYNLQVAKELLVGQNIANLVAILGSIDIVLGEVDG